MGFFTKSSAMLSPCQKYRYFLARTWDASKSRALFVMLNPSVADAATDDPTIRRCVRFAQQFGCGGIRVVNLFAYRATDPSELRTAVSPVEHTLGENNTRIRSACRHSSPVIAAWGKDGRLQGRDKIVWRILADMGKVYCLGCNKDGSPKHPLFLSYNQELEVYKWERP